MVKETEIEVLKHKLNWYEKKYGPYIEKRGLHNWKNLFRKPTLLEWTILVMLLLGLFMGWAYQHDTALCRETMKNIKEICLQYNTPLPEQNYTIPEINFSILNSSIKK